MGHSYELSSEMYILGQEREGRLGYCVRGGGGWIFTSRERLDAYAKQAQLGPDAVDRFSSSYWGKAPKWLVIWACCPADRPSNHSLH